jgi:hypothetical protein
MGSIQTVFYCEADYRGSNSNIYVDDKRPAAKQ